ncbi:MAG: hypothetical protein ACYC7A_15260 [Thermoanaerobaculia bacterium]
MVKRELLRCLNCAIACFLTFKLVVLATPDPVARTPYGRDWLLWLLNPFEFLFPVGVSLAVYLLLWLLLRRLSTIEIIVWGGWLGLYTAVVGYPIDAWSRFDDMTRDSLPDTAATVLLEALVVCVVVPAFAAWLVRASGSVLRSRRTLTANGNNS